MVRKSHVAIGMKTDRSYTHGAAFLLALDGRGLTSLPRTPKRGEGERHTPSIRHWYENDVTRRRDCPQSTVPALVNPAPNSSFRRRPESRGAGMGNVVRGLVPRWGRVWAWQHPPCEFAVLNHNFGSSSLGVPAPAGMSDWCENHVTWVRQCLRVTRISRIVIPAPRSSFRRRPESRGVGRGECSAVEDFARRGACPPLGRRRGVAESAVPIRRNKPQLRAP